MVSDTVLACTITVCAIFIHLLYLYPSIDVTTMAVADRSCGDTSIVVQLNFVPEENSRLWNICSNVSKCDEDVHVSFCDISSVCVHVCISVSRSTEKSGRVYITLSFQLIRQCKNMCMENCLLIFF